MIGQWVVTALMAAVIAAPVGGLVSGRIDPVRYDFGRLLEPDGSSDLSKAQSDAERLILARHGLPPDADFSTAPFTDCLTAAELHTLAGIGAARKAGTPDAWRLARRQADDALERRSSLRRHLWAGEPATDPYFRGVSSRLQRARATTDPVIAELLRLGAEDNFARLGLAFFSKQTYAVGLSEAAYDLTDAQARREICLADQASHAWLVRRVATGDWVRSGRDGAAAADVAWLLAQHADRDRPLQKLILGQMAPLLDTGDIDPSNYGYLYDRVAVGDGRPQRYGTQGSRRLATRSAGRPRRCPAPA
jgi:hypothetical protein